MLIERKFPKVPVCDIKRGDEELAKWCRFWMDALVLNEWTVDVAYTSIRALNGQYAICERSSHLKTANIFIMSPTDIAEGDINGDIEKTLVHELLHLKFWCNEPDEETDPTGYRVHEQSIDTTASAIVEIRRNAYRGS